MWYDINKTLTYNCLFNLVIGARGTGKTYGAKKRAIKQFIDKKYQFVYLRRYSDELDEVKESVFNDIIVNNEFPDHVIEYKSDKYYLDGEIMGYAMALTKAKNYKSISYPMVYLIIYDEFLIEDNGYARYLKNEVKQFLSFYMTIDRYRGCTAFLLANAVTMINPYTIAWDLYLPFNSNIVRKKEILLELVHDEEFIKSRKATRFGTLIDGTEFSEYAIDNKFTLDKKDFVEKKSGSCSYYFTFKYLDVLYGVWISYQQGKIWVSEDVDPSCRIVYSLTLDDHTPNTLFLKNMNKSAMFKNFIDAYKQGNVYFESQRIKNIVYDVIKLSV